MSAATQDVQIANDAQRGTDWQQRMVRAIRDLLDHPFPHDLMKLRRQVASEYDGDEAVAKAEMEEWCSQELCDRELDAYIEARKAGNAIIAEYGPNGESSNPALTPHAKGKHDE